MPTIIRQAGFRVWINNPPREHGPAHVHVENADAEIVVDLPANDQPLQLREDYGMRPSDLVRAIRLVEANVERLLDEWRRIHG